MLLAVTSGGAMAEKCGNAAGAPGAAEREGERAVATSRLVMARAEGLGRDGGFRSMKRISLNRRCRSSPSRSVQDERSCKAGTMAPKAMAEPVTRLETESSRQTVDIQNGRFHMP